MAGGGSSRDASGKKKARIEIIPLIDVIFFLLATFVLFTLSMQRTNGLPVALPEAQNTEPRDPAGTATVTVKEDGSFAWDKDLVTVEEMENRMKEFHAQHPEPDAHLLINGDKNAFFYQAIFAFDEARKAGIQRVLIETEFKPASS
jgi:biopolymer transport protein ExbD